MYLFFDTVSFKVRVFLNLWTVIVVTGDASVALGLGYHLREVLNRPRPCS